MSRYFTEMVDVLRAAGVECRVEDVNAGWESRARSSGGFADGKPLGITWHHTASSASPHSNCSTSAMTAFSSSSVASGSVTVLGCFDAGGIVISVGMA